MIEAFEQRFGSWRSLREAPGLITPRGVRVRIIVHRGGEDARSPVPLRYRMPDPDRVLLHTHGSLGVVDAGRGDGVAYVTRQLLADRPHFQYGVLEMLVLVLVTTRGRIPVHASAVTRNGAALLLAGPTGSGKSTLAYGARELGCGILSDDAAYVQTDPVFRIWGMPGPVHLAPQAAGHFAELRARKSVRMANGKRKVSVPGDQGGGVGGTPWATRAGVCLLRRTPRGRARLARVSASALHRALLADLKDQAGLYGESLARALSHLCARGGWRIHLSDDPREALPYIERMLSEIAAQP